MTHILVGTNWFALKVELDRLVAEFVRPHGDLALERLDGEEASHDDIVQALESLPFLASKKMVVIESLSENKQASESMEALIEKAGDTTDLVIVEGKLDKRSVYYKQLKKLKGFQEFNELDEHALTMWVQKHATERGATISAGDARYLVQRVGLSQTALANEVYKLAQYDPKISKRSIEALVDETPTSTIFNLLDLAFSGQSKKALDIYQEQRMQKVEPQAIHAMFVWQMHIVALADVAPTKADSSEIARDAGINPFVAQKSQSIAHRMGRAKIRSFMKLLRDIDLDSKTKTLNYDEAMRFAILSLAN